MKAYITILAWFLLLLFAIRSVRMCVVTGLWSICIGLIVGIPRYRTGRVHGSLILHALVNLIGR